MWEMNCYLDELPVLCLWIILDYLEDPVDRVVFLQSDVRMIDIVKQNRFLETIKELNVVPIFGGKPIYDLREKRWLERKIKEQEEEEKGNEEIPTYQGFAIFEPRETKFSMKNRLDLTRFENPAQALDFQRFIGELLFLKEYREGIRDENIKDLKESDYYKDHLKCLEDQVPELVDQHDPMKNYLQSISGRANDPVFDKKLNELYVDGKIDESEKILAEASQLDNDHWLASLRDPKNLEYMGTFFFDQDGQYESTATHDPSGRPLLKPLQPINTRKSITGNDKYLCPGQPTETLALRKTFETWLDARYRDNQWSESQYEIEQQMISGYRQDPRKSISGRLFYN